MRLNTIETPASRQNLRLIKAEVARCSASKLYFISTYCKIYDPPTQSWIPFVLWPAQVYTLSLMEQFQFFIGLKTRQVGLTWLELALTLWDMLFAPIATCLLFSRRDDEAMYLLGPERLKGMYAQLPPWLQTRSANTDNAHVFGLSNGSTCRAFPPNAGDSYTATRAVIDEADLVPDLNALMRSVRPTIEAGGKLHLISRVDKGKPGSEFKNIYRAARSGEAPDWGHVFLPWYAHPNRTRQWHTNLCAETMAQTGSLDDVHEQYPATDVEALAPRALDKRIPPHWVERAYVEMESLHLDDHRDLPDIPGLRVYQKPEAHEHYVIGLDPAEGNPTSDDSALTVMNVRTLEEVASLRGKFQPAVLASHADKLGQWYNQAAVMPERNNHGHAVILWLRDYSPLEVLQGHDRSDGLPKYGWNSSSLGKVLLYDAGSDAFRDETTTVHSFDTMTQIQSIEGSTLRAPGGFHDDLSDSYMLCLVGAPRAVATDWSKAEVV